MTRCYRYAAGDGIMATYTASHLARSAASAIKVKFEKVTVTFTY